MCSAVKSVLREMRESRKNVTEVPWSERNLGIDHYLADPNFSSSPLPLTLASLEKKMTSVSCM